jgi:hypothetical protein
MILIGYLGPDDRCYGTPLNKRDYPGRLGGSGKLARYRQRLRAGYADSHRYANGSRRSIDAVIHESSCPSRPTRRLAMFQSMLASVSNQHPAGDIKYEVKVVMSGVVGSFLARTMLQAHAQSPSPPCNSTALSRSCFPALLA